MRITVKEAAKRMGATEQLVRVGLQQGLFPFGSAIKTSTQYTYYITSEALDEFMKRGKTYEANSNNT